MSQQKCLKAFLPKREDIDPNDPMYRMIANGAQYYKSNLPQPDMISGENIKRWDMSVYVAFAENSVLHDSNKAYEKAKNIIKDIRGKVWANTTHSLPMEIPSQIDSELIRFWNENDDRM